MKGDLFKTLITACHPFGNRLAGHQGQVLKDAKSALSALRLSFTATFT